MKNTTTIIKKEVFEELKEKNGNHLSFWEAGEMMKAYQGGELIELIAVAFSYGYERAKKEATKCENM